MKNGILTIVCLSVLATSTTLAQGRSGTTLTATVDIAPHWSKTFGWTIEKSVTPTLWNLFKGDQGTSEYTITVTKDNGTVEAWVDGRVCITNGGAVATDDLAIELVLQDGYGPPNDFLAEAAVDVSGNLVLDPGETGCYSYRVSIPIIGGTFPQPHAGGTYKVTANVTISNHSGHLGESYGPSPSATALFPSSIMLINDTINVDDSNGRSWAFNASGPVNYSRTFAAEADKGTHANTAKIRETGQSAIASVTVNCYALEVTKDATTSLKRTYNWTIDKSADQTSLTLAPGESFLVNYRVKVDKATTAYSDNDWRVSGNVTVKNPAPMDAPVISEVDIISPDNIAASGGCGVSFPYSLSAGATLHCTYIANLPDGTAQTNTATVQLQNYSYDYQLNKTATSTTNFSGTAAVDFAQAEITEIDKCADVTDSYAGALGSDCVSDLPKEFTYSRTIGPYSTGGNYSVDNTALVVTLDRKVSTPDSWDIAVKVPLSGCTLTPGYWKTHSRQGPAPYDDNWKNLGSLEENTVFFLSSQTYYEVLWTTPKGNAYYILAHAFVAAQLNFLKSADLTAAQAAYNSATELFNAYTPADISKLKGSSSVRQSFVNCATVLDNYNNGIIGPGHCSEQSGGGAGGEGSSNELTAERPTGYALHQNYPNPFNPATQIAFAVDRPGHANLVVYSILGDVVATLFDDVAEPGRYYYVEFDASNLSSGMYFYRLQAGDFVQTKKLLLLK